MGMSGGGWGVSGGCERRGVGSVRCERTGGCRGGCEMRGGGGAAGLVPTGCERRGVRVQPAIGGEVGQEGGGGETGFEAGEAGGGEGGGRVQPAIGCSGEGGEEGAAAAAAAAVEQSVLSACSFKTSHQRLCVKL